MERKPKPTPEPATPPSFEQNLKRLEEVVKQLEASDLPLEDALKLFESGMGLSAVCDQQLSAAEHRVEILMSRPSGVVPEPFADASAGLPATGASAAGAQDDGIESAEE